MDGYVTRSQFAVIYGCSKPYVTRLVADKRVVLSTDGKLINVEASMRLLDVTSDPSKAGVRDRWAAYRAGQMPAGARASRSADAATNTPGAVGGMAPAAGEAGASPASSTPAPPASQPESARSLTDESAYHQARTKREQAEAELATIELKKALGQVLDAPSTLRAFVDVQIVARNELLALADRLAPLVTPETDARKVYAVIQAEAERVCETIGSKIAALSADSLVLA